MVVSIECQASCWLEREGGREGGREEGGKGVSSSEMRTPFLPSHLQTSSSMYIIGSPINLELRSFPLYSCHSTSFIH